MSSSATMQAQQFARSKMDYLIYKGYANLQVQTKSIVLDTAFKDSVALGTISTDVDGVSSRVVTVSVYNGDEAVPRAILQQVFYSNDATKYVHNINSPSNDISIGYNAENDKVYASVDGVEKPLGSDGGVPVGTIIPWMFNTAPTEGGTWLLCDGSTYSPTAYPKLFALLTTSVLPDLRGRFLQGSSNAGIFVDAGLPNITGRMHSTDWAISGWDVYNQGMKIDSKSALNVSGRGGISHAANQNNWSGSVKGIDFDASRSNAIYGNSDTVQPPAMTVRYYIKAA